MNSQITISAESDMVAEGSTISMPGRTRNTWGKAMALVVAIFNFWRLPRPFKRFVSNDAESYYEVVSVDSPTTITIKRKS